ncbi:PREDICTED: E3 ubiquitin-protein ligase TRIM71-like isoform X1 [Amphimedon queenslandica]|nr:PREDICTED: E3 ubiquitin-protein ligase TRIM71-like isoform X1 [Amphimedon queenslandica]|eukprot:XP_019856595.1 PREDICTED: E3 ubiquitin-protein ligase TRIM71-like isoform X1 [Amphimedon queenslandica]
MVSKDTLTEVKSCGCSLVGDPMLLILNAVAEDHSKLCTLTSILMKSKEAVSLASDIIMEYGKSFPLAATVMPFCTSRSGQLQGSSSETQVTTNTDATAQAETVIFYPDDKAEFDRMGDMRGTLIHNIVPLIKAAIPSSIPSVDDLKTYLGRCRPELKPRLKDTNCFDDVMEVIEDECSITNVALLETIVNKYSIQDAGDMILAYQTHLDEFCENKLTMFCNRQLKRLSSSLLTCETIKFVLKWNPSEHSLSSIRALLWKTFKDNQVEVVVIKEGNSIIVTCYAPHYLMESLLVTARDNVDMLKETGLISLTIGYYTVYDEHAIDEEVKSLMKKLEMVESERDVLLEENTKLKGTIDTLGISYEGREVDESNKSSIQSSESEKEDSKKKLKKAMQMEIDHLRSSLQSKTVMEEMLIGVEKTLIEREKEIELLQEKISLMNIQQLKETSITLRKDQSTQSIDPLKGSVYEAIRDWEARRSDIAAYSIDSGLAIPLATVKKERKFKVALPAGIDKAASFLEASFIKSDEEGRVMVNDNNTAIVSCTPQSIGGYELSVTIRGHHIKGSPYQLSVKASRDYTTLTNQRYFVVGSSTTGVAVHTNGEVFAGSWDGFVQVFSEDGTAVKRFGCKGNGSGQFDYPFGLLLVGDRVYVSDHNLNLVQYFSATTGQYIGQFGSKGNGNGQFSNPCGMSTDGKGNILVAEYSNNRVQVFKEDGTFVQVIQCDGTASDVAVDNEGKIHVTITNQNHVQVFSPDGKTHLDTYNNPAGNFNSPSGIAIDDEGYILVSSNNGYLHVLSPDRKQVKLISGLSNPWGVALDKDGYIYVAECGNYHVMKY